MFWPQASDYREAIQNLGISFRDSDLCNGQAACSAMGLPLTWTGNFAAVFHVRGAMAHQDWAVKCFTKDKPGLQERYRHIDAHLQQQGLPFMVRFQYLPDEVLVRGGRFAALKMDWVEGLRLDQFLADCLTQPNYQSTLRMLCDMWFKLAQRLRLAQVAHGDLQHGNVLLVPVPGKEAYNLRLVDYDGMCVPALTAKASQEVGHPAYQHPQRIAEGGYGPEIDRFSHLLIFTSLRCLIAGGRDLWNQFHDGDRLLLGAPDLLEPETSDVFQSLWRLEDPAAHALVGHLVLATKEQLGQVPLLEHVVAGSQVVGLSGDQQRRVEGWMARRGTTTSERPPAATTHRVSPAAVVNDGRPLIVSCRCGQRFQAAPHLLGQWVPCPVCGEPIEIAGPANAPSEMRVMPNEREAEWVGAAPSGARPPAGTPGFYSALPDDRPWLQMMLFLRHHGLAVGGAFTAVLVILMLLIALLPGNPKTISELQKAPPDIEASIGGTEIVPPKPPLPAASGATTAPARDLTEARWDASMAKPQQQDSRSAENESRGGQNDMENAWNADPTPSTLNADPTPSTDGTTAPAPPANGILSTADRGPDGAAVEPVASPMPPELGDKAGVFRGHADAVVSVAFHPSGRQILTGSNDGTAMLWDAQSQQRVRSFEAHGEAVESVAFSLNGQHLLTGGRDDRALLWETETGARLGEFRSQRWSILSVAFHPDGRRIATGCADRTTVLWDVVTGERVRTVRGDTGNASSLAFSPDGQRLLTASVGSSASLWDVATGQQVCALEGHSGRVLSVAFAPDGQSVLTGAWDNTAVLWDAATGAALQTFRGHEKPVRCVAFRHDSTVAVTGSDDRTAALWSTVTGSRLHVFEGHDGAVCAVAFHPDGRQVLTGSRDHTAILWNAEERDSSGNAPR